MGTYVVGVDMFSDRINGKLIRGFKGDKVELDDDRAKPFLESKSPSLFSESDWEKKQKGEPVLGGPTDAQPSGATAGIVTENVQADVPTPEAAARQRALDEQAEGTKSSADTKDDGATEGTEDTGGDEGNANATSPAKAAAKKSTK